MAPEKMVTPDRSLQQRMEALARANKIRLRRAQFKRDLKAGKVRAHEFLMQPPEWLESMKIFDLVMAVPKYGRAKTNQVLNLVRISPSRTVGGMSDRQRQELISKLRR
jgi:hypothetical protein